jgi:hypothetical protein
LLQRNFQILRPRSLLAKNAGEANDSDSKEEKKQKSARSKKKHSNSKKANKKAQKDLTRAEEITDNVAREETSPAISYSQAVSKTSFDIRKDTTTQKS